MKILALEFSSSQRSVAVADLPDLAPPAPKDHPSAQAAGRDVPREADLIPNQAALVCDEPGVDRALSGLFEKRAGEPAAFLSSVVENTPHHLNALGMVDRALCSVGWEREMVECIVVGLGPGSYTGIRAAIALAQGWQLARNIQLLGISSMEALAWEARAQGCAGPAHLVMDAQRGEFYCASYFLDARQVQVTEPLCLASLDEVNRRALQGGLIIGPEATRWFPGARNAFPHASHFGRLAVHRHDFVIGCHLTPIYLRPAQFVKAPPPRILPA